MNKPKIYMMIGVPGVGKTTWVHKNLKCVQTESLYEVISSDDIIAKIAFILDATYDEVFDFAIKFSNKKVEKNIIETTSNVKPCIIDRTNLTVKSRAKILSLIKNRERYEVIAVYISAPDIFEHRKRLDSRIGKTIPSNVIENMERLLEIPTLEEGFDSIIFVKG